MINCNCGGEAVIEDGFIDNSNCSGKFVCCMECDNSTEVYLPHEEYEAVKEWEFKNKR